MVCNSYICTFEVFRADNDLGRYSSSMTSDPFFTHNLLRREDLEDRQYPLVIPAVEQIESIRFHPQVTIFAGETGSGKSTLIEAIAIAAGFNAEGGRKSFRTEQTSTDVRLADAITLARTANREKDGFFLRAESSYVLSNYLNEIGASGFYGGDLHRRSHGEGFMAIFLNRFRDVRKALFILDEVESALSPQRQLEFLALMRGHIGRGSQFIISTHSPILMSYPESCLYWLDKHGLTKQDWRETNHFKLYQAILSNPEIVHQELRSNP